MNLDEVKNSWGLSSPKIKNKSGQTRSIDSAVLDIKRNVCDMMRDIQSLTEIDYPKMLALKVHSTQIRYSLTILQHQTSTKTPKKLKLDLYSANYATTTK